MLIGFIAGMIIAYFLDSNVSNVLFQDRGIWLPALVTIIAGGMAFLIGQKQIDHQIEAAATIRKQKLYAARAVLPIALSNIGKVCDFAVVATLNSELLKTDKVKARGAFDKIDIAEDDLETMKECIEFADAASQAWMSVVLAHFQIQKSRLEGNLFDENLIVLRIHTIKLAVEWQVINCIVGELFDFARTGAKSRSRLQEDLFKSPFFNLGVAGVILDTTEIEDAVERYRKNIDDHGGWEFAAFTARLSTRAKQDGL